MQWHIARDIWVYTAIAGLCHICETDGLAVSAKHKTIMVSAAVARRRRDDDDDDDEIALWQTYWTGDVSHRVCGARLLY